MTDFNTAFDQQRALSIRAWIACYHITDISHFWRRHIAIPVNTEIVFAVDVCTRGEVAHGGNGTVNYHRNRHIYRAEGTRTGVHQRADLFFRREGQRAGNLRQFFCFDFVQFMIAANQQGDQRRFAALNGFHQQRFDRFFNRQIELLNQLGDGFGIRRIHHGHFLSGCGTRCFWCDSFSKFNVGGVVRSIGEDHIIFAALRQYLKFM